VNRIKLNLHVQFNEAPLILRGMIHWQECRDDLYYDGIQFETDEAGKERMNS